jgi:hypothetical protein
VTEFLAFAAEVLGFTVDTLDGTAISMGLILAWALVSAVVSMVIGWIVEIVRRSREG